MDASFNLNAIRMRLFQFRVKNSGDYRYVAAETLLDAARKLSRIGVVPDQLQLAGELIEERT